MQHTMRIRNIIICGMPRSTIFFHIPQKGQDFRKREKLLYMKYVFRYSLQLLSEKCFILRRNERDRIKNAYWFSCKIPCILSRF